MSSVVQCAVAVFMPDIGHPGDVWWSLGRTVLRPNAARHDWSTHPVSTADSRPWFSIVGPILGPMECPNGPDQRRRRVRPRPRLRRSGPQPSVSTQSAPEGIRTPNLLIRSQMLYPLSYGRGCCPEDRPEQRRERLPGGPSAAKSGCRMPPAGGGATATVVSDRIPISKERNAFRVVLAVSARTSQRAARRAPAVSRLTSRLDRSWYLPASCPAYGDQIRSVHPLGQGQRGMDA